MIEDSIAVKDIIDFKEFQQLMDEFYNLTGLPISIADKSNNILVGSQTDSADLQLKQDLSFPIDEEVKMNFDLSENSFLNFKSTSGYTYEQISRTIFVEENHVATILVNTSGTMDGSSLLGGFKLDKKTKVTEFESKKITKSNSIFTDEQLDRILSFVSSIAAIISELIKTNYKLRNEIQINAESRKALEIATSKAAESDMLKNEFLRNISHEIRTPLNGIIGFSELLALDRNNEKTEVYKNQIQASGYRLLEIIENIITYSQIQTGDVKLIPSKTSLQSIIDQVMLKLDTKACQRKNRLLQIRKSDNVDDTITVDSSKLSRMLELVVDNAIKFTFDGTIQIGGYISGNSKKSAILFVEDTGIGIPDEDKEIVFEAFRQVETGLSRDYGGNGLGLSITKSFVDAMGGKIRLTSEPGKGTKVIISVPVLC